MDPHFETPSVGNLPFRATISRWPISTPAGVSDSVEIQGDLNVTGTVERSPIAFKVWKSTQQDNMAFMDAVEFEEMMTCH